MVAMSRRNAKTQEGEETDADEDTDGQDFQLDLHG